MQPSLFSKEPSGSKSRPKDLPKLLMRYCWQRLQNGQTEFVVDDTEDAFLGWHSSRWLPCSI